MYVFTVQSHILLYSVIFMLYLLIFPYDSYITALPRIYIHIFMGFFFHSKKTFFSLCPRHDFCITHKNNEVFSPVKM